MNAIVPAETAVRAFQQAALMRRIGASKPIESIAALARELERDEANTRKSLKTLERDGLVAPTAASGHVLTSIGLRALQALDVAEGSSDVAGGILQLQHSAIRPNPLNPRTNFDEAGLAELADSIAGVDQVIVPLIVFPAGADGAHTLAAGERRWRAVEALIKDGRWPADRPLPCIEREEDPAQAALIGLVENGQREDLNLYDQAQAYVALMDATDWSARECAKRTGKSARAVQEAVQVARSASPADVEAYQAGDLTWEELRTGVRKPVERPAPEIELQQTLARSGPATMGAAPSPPADQTDIVDLIDETPKFTPSPKMALVLLEIADKASHDGMSKWRSAFTVVAADYAEPGGVVPDLLRARAISFRKVSGQDEVRIEPGGPAEAWLKQAGFHEDDQLGRQWRLYDVRIDATSNTAQATACKLDSSYFTPWLNVKAARPAEAEQTPASQAVGPGADGLEPKPRELLMLVELADKCAREPSERRSSGGSTLCGEHYPDPTHLGTALIKHGGGFASGGGKPQTAHLGQSAYTWLQDRELLPTADNREELLRRLRTETVGSTRACSLWEADVYFTPWLNLKANKASEDTPAEPAEEPADHDDEVAAQLLAAVTALAHSEPDPAEIAKALTEVGAPLPWRLSDDPNDCGVILDVAGGTVAVVDVHNELADDTARARALAITTAINSAFAEAAA